MAKNCNKKSKTKEQIKTDFKLLHDENKKLKRLLELIQKQYLSVVKQNRDLQKELLFYKPTIRTPINLLKSIGAPITYLEERYK